MACSSFLTVEFQTLESRRGNHFRKEILHQERASMLSFMQHTGTGSLSAMGENPDHAS
jgi:hypothetical protein